LLVADRPQAPVQIGGQAANLLSPLRGLLRPYGLFLRSAFSTVAPAARTCGEKICGSLERVEYLVELVKYLSLLFPDFILAALNIFNVRLMKSACGVDAPGNLVDVVADVAERSAALVHAVKFDTNDATIYRLFEKIGAKIFDTRLRHTLVNHIVLFRRHAEVDGLVPF
jgi:hypothetical protein